MKSQPRPEQRPAPGSLEEESLRAEIDRLTRENLALRKREKRINIYIRDKVNQLLRTVGTCPLRPEELDDDTLVALDPIGIVNDTFAQILEHLRETNSKLALARDEIAAIFHAAGAGILVLDRDKNILSYNRKLQEDFLVGEREVLGCRCSEVICGVEGGMSECVFEKVMDSGHGEHRSDIHYGERHYDVVGVPLGEGEISQVVLVYSDITEQKISEAALRGALEEARDARRKIDAILQSVSDPLLVIDNRERVVLVNRAAEELLGVCLFQFLGLALEKAIHDPELLQQIKTALLGRNPARLDFTLTRDGAERVFQARTSPLHDLSGAHAGTVILMHDVTREREVERMKSEFITTAAHELQTPLTAIIGFAELLQGQKDLPEEIRGESLHFIQQKAESLSRIVDDLLDLGRIESGRDIELQLEAVDINHVLRQVIRSYDLRSTRHRLEMILPEKEVRLRIDWRRIAQVLENVLSNAVKYSPAGGTIQVFGRCEGDAYRVTVADRGIGMTATQLEHIFERFYRGDASNTSIGGTGLGMSIARHIVEAHDGAIWVESEPGQGTRVHFRLPLEPSTSPATE